LAAKKQEEWLKHYGSATVGERGQIALPVEARERFKIKSGEKLLVFGSDAGGFERIVLMKADGVTGLLKHLFSMEQFVKQGGVRDLKKIINKEKGRK